MKKRSLMAEKEKEPINQSKYLSDSDSFNDNEINSRLKTSVEERQYNSIPGSAIATHIALSYLRAQANPTIEREDHHVRKLKLINLLHKKQRIKTVRPKANINDGQLL